MRIAFTYVYPNNGAGDFYNLAVRFIVGYHEMPAGIEHESIVVCNGSPVTEEAKFLFGSLHNVHFLSHDNSGYDIGAYQHAAREHPCDLMVFFGASTYFKGKGWLRRMVESYERHGEAIYGVMGNRGAPHVGVWPHIRTTGFWMSTKLFNQYPHKITQHQQRYPFEHGRECLTNWVCARGLQAWVVTWDGEYLHAGWDAVPNGFHNGNQSNLLVGDRLTEPPFYHTP